MSVHWYDKSVVEKLRTITGDDRISLMPVENLFRYIANLKQDDIKMPLINIARLGYRLKKVTRSPMTSDGVVIGRSGSSVDRMQAIPIEIQYQIDVITRKRDDNDMFTSEIIFYFINNPTLQVDIERGVNDDHNFNLYLDEDVPDNSDIESHQRNGEYFRSTLRLFTDDAYLWKMTRECDKKVPPVNFIATEDLEDSSKDYMNETIKINKENE